MRCEQYEDLVGKKLLHNIVNTTGMMLIPENTVLTEAHVGKLEKFQISLFDIVVEELDEKKTFSDPAAEPIQAVPERSGAGETAPSGEGKTVTAVLARADAAEMMKRTDAKMRDIEKLILNTGIIPLTEVEEHVLPDLMQTTQNQNVYKLFADLRAEEDYRFKHSIGVACMSAVLGRWLGMDETEVSTLATAASLCDIGTIKLPSSLVHKTSELLVHEQEIMKQHTILGYELLKQSGVEERVALVALQHHERGDGSGYPARLHGAEIDPFAKIVALADDYLMMATDRPNKPALPFYQIIRNLHEDIVSNRYDSVIGMTFLNRLMAAQVGSDVRLTDGRRGKIVLIYPNYPTRPLIALDDGFIDLSKTDAVQVMDVIG
ncbi:HD-GYP domain-containing protein [Paenibacillus hodogayensis]|uniref:HD-GYP domain-containing protein n=1 Tax=Paenibacillus hodogayensis TaxID=279208 RepID=A0ABV5VQW1_9BACL